jgi:hypothetical protein
MSRVLSPPKPMTRGRRISCCEAESLGETGQLVGRNWQQVLVNRDPQPEEGYGSTFVVREGESFAPLAAPQSIVRVNDLLL